MANKYSFVPSDERTKKITVTLPCRSTGFWFIDSAVSAAYFNLHRFLSNTSFKDLFSCDSISFEIPNIHTNFYLPQFKLTLLCHPYYDLSFCSDRLTSFWEYYIGLSFSEPLEVTEVKEVDGEEEQQ